MGLDLQRVEFGLSRDGGFEVMLVGVSLATEDVSHQYLLLKRVQRAMVDFLEHVRIDVFMT